MAIKYGKSNISGGSNLTRPLLKAEKINMTSELGLPEWPQIETITCVNNDTAYINQLEDGKTYSIPFWQNLQKGAFAKVEVPMPTDTTTIKEFFDNNLGYTILGTFGNTTIYKTKGVLYPNTIYNYNNVPEYIAKNAINLDQEALVIKVVGADETNYYINFPSYHAQGITGVLIDIPLVASASYNYADGFAQIVGNPNYPGTYPNCNALGYVMKHIWYKQTFDNSTNKAITDIKCLGVDETFGAPTFVNGINEFSIKLKNENATINNLDAILQILNGSTHQNLTEADLGGAVDTYNGPLLQLPKYLNLHNNQNFLDLNDDWNDTKSISFNSCDYPWYGGFNFQKVLAYYTPDVEDHARVNATLLDIGALWVEFNVIKDLNVSSGQFAHKLYIYPFEDMTNVNYISCGPNFIALDENQKLTGVNLKAHTWYCCDNGYAAGAPYGGAVGPSSMITEVERPLEPVPAFFGTASLSQDIMVDINKDIFTCDGAKDENGDFIIHQKQTGDITKNILNNLQEQIDELNVKTDAANNYLAELHEDLTELEDSFDEFKESTQESIDDLQEQIDNIQPGEVGSLKSKLYDVKPVKLIDGETYTLRSDINAKSLNLEHEMLMYPKELDTDAIKISLDYDTNDLMFHNPLTGVWLYLIDGQWWLDENKQELGVEPEITWDSERYVFTDTTALQNNEYITLKEKFDSFKKEIDTEISAGLLKNKTYDTVEGTDLGWIIENNWDSIIAIAGGNTMYPCYGEESKMVIAYTEDFAPLPTIYYATSENQYLMLSEPLEIFPANVWIDMESMSVIDDLPLPEIKDEFIVDENLFNLIVGPKIKKITLEEKFNNTCFVLTEAPTEDNTSRQLGIVVLSDEPAERFSGYIYVKAL